MKSERQQKEATSRMIQPSKDGKQFFKFIDNRTSDIRQLCDRKQVKENSALQNTESIKEKKPNISRQIIQLSTIWQWNGTYWNALQTEGYPSAQPGRPGIYDFETITTGEDEEDDTIEPPYGYELVSDSMSGRTTYLCNPNEYVIGRVALDHIIDVAHGNEGRIHRSSQMTGTRIETYIHPSDDELYTFTIQENHSDGIPKITIHEQGKVRAGVHKFGK